jgi:hypothetical protein
MEMEREMERWRDGRDGEMERWRDEEMERSLPLCLQPAPPHKRVGDEAAHHTVMMKVGVAVSEQVWLLKGWLYTDTNTFVVWARYYLFQIQTTTSIHTHDQGKNTQHNHTHTHTHTHRHT